MRWLLYLLVIFPFVSGASAASTPLQASLYSPLQFVPESWSVTGIRLNLIYGRNLDVYGLDVGLVNSTDRHQGGVQLGLLGNIVATEEEFAVFDKRMFSAGNRSPYLKAPESSMTGIQLALIGNTAGDMHGIQFGMINQAVDMRGLQLGVNVFAVNESLRQTKGLQLAVALAGPMNKAEDMSGLQISVGAVLGISSARDMTGIQLTTGLLPLANEARTMGGLQIGPVLLNKANDLSGAQLFGIVNKVEGTMTGLQLGIVNYSQHLHGVQIGVVNIVRESPVPFLPFINAHF